MTIYFTLSEGNKQVSIKKLELIADHYKHMADTLKKDEVQELIKKWEGKKYTKRLETALKNIDKYFRVDTTLNNPYLEFYFFDKRSFQLDNNCRVYVKGGYTISSIETSTLYNTHDVKENLHTELLQRAENYQRMYEKLTKQIKQINKIIKEFNKIKDLYNAFEDEYTYDILNEFNLYLQRR